MANGNAVQDSHSAATAPQTWEPRILAFLCNWCSYAGADLAGTSRLQYPPNVRVIRVPCSGRVNPIFIVEALRQGADGVLVSGCHPGDCHYLEGNYYARRRFAMLQRYLTYLGIEEGRVQFSWVSASEAARFAEVVTKVTEDVRRLGPSRRLRIRPVGEDASPLLAGHALSGLVEGLCPSHADDAAPEQGEGETR